MIKQLSILILIIPLFWGCSMYDDLRNDLNDLTERVEALEYLCESINNDIAALQVTVEALEAGDYITSIEPMITNNEVAGYVLTFAKYGSVTIYNGKDGTDGQDGEDGKDGYTPQIGVSIGEDGAYYWTLDGEWLLDADGNKIPVSGKDGADGSDGEDGADGKDGITPQLMIKDDYWYVSYDKGVWIKLGKATGEDGSDGSDGSDGKDGQDGEKGDSIFSNVTYDDSYVYLVLANNGVTLTIPRKIDKFDITFEGGNEFVCASGETVSIPYTLSYGGKNAEVVAIPFGEWDVTVRQITDVAGVIDVNAPSPMREGEILILASDGDEKTIMRKLIFDKGYINVISQIFVTDSDSSSLEVTLGTNTDYTIIIPDDAKSWISVADVGTKSLARTDVVTFDIRVNLGTTRTANISFVDEANELLNTVEISQAGVSAAKNEIWYTSSDGRPVFPTNYDEAAYAGPDIVKNTYGKEKGVIVFAEDLDTLWHTAFARCENLTGITIPEGVVHIDGWAFQDCKNLTGVTIPQGVVCIDNYAFDSCSSLVEINLPESLTYIGESAFSWCLSLVEITIPEHVTDIGYAAFGNANERIYRTIFCRPAVPPVLHGIEGAISWEGPAFSIATTIYVPTESLGLYKSASIWRKSANQIKGYDFAE